MKNAQYQAGCKRGDCIVLWVLTTQVPKEFRNLLSHAVIQYWKLFQHIQRDIDSLFLRWDEISSHFPSFGVIKGFTPRDWRGPPSQRKASFIQTVIHNFLTSSCFRMFGKDSVGWTWKRWHPLWKLWSNPSEFMEFMKPFPPSKPSYFHSREHKTLFFRHRSPPNPKWGDKMRNDIHCLIRLRKFKSALSWERHHLPLYPRQMDLI